MDKANTFGLTVDAMMESGITEDNMVKGSTQHNREKLAEQAFGMMVKGKDGLIKMKNRKMIELNIIINPIKFKYSS